MQEVRSILRGSIEQGWPTRPCAGSCSTPHSREESRSMRSMRCSRICWSCTGTNAPTRSPDLRQRSSLVRKSLAACSCLTSAAGSAARHRCCCGATVLGSVILALIGLFPSFWIVIVLLASWALLFAAVTPVRRAYLNGLIESKERATVLSFDSLLGSLGAVICSADSRVGCEDTWRYPASYIASAAIQTLSIPFIWLARREEAPTDAARSRR